MRVALPSTENNFYYAKLIYNQEKISQKIKNEVILDCANKLFSETENLPNEFVIKKVIESNFSIQNFIEILAKENNLSLKFREESPERHITYYSHEKLIDIQKNLIFNFILLYIKVAHLQTHLKIWKYLILQSLSGQFMGNLLNNKFYQINLVFC